MTVVSVQPGFFSFSVYFCCIGFRSQAWSRIFKFRVPSAACVFSFFYTGLLVTCDAVYYIFLHEFCLRISSFILLSFYVTWAYQIIASIQIIVLTAKYLYVLSSGLNNFVLMVFIVISFNEEMHVQTVNIFGSSLPC